MKKIILIFIVLLYSCSDKIGYTERHRRQKYRINWTIGRHRNYDYTDTVIINSNGCATYKEAFSQDQKTICGTFTVEEND